jgi:hypothetical protein
MSQLGSHGVSELELTVVVRVRRVEAGRLAPPRRSS